MRIRIRRGIKFGKRSRGIFAAARDICRSSKLWERLWAGWQKKRRARPERFSRCKAVVSIRNLLCLELCEKHIPRSAKTSGAQRACFARDDNQRRLSTRG